MVRPEQRAHKLLLSHLSPQQRETYAKRKWFEVRGGRSGRTYRIHGDRSGPGSLLGRNVTLMWRGKPVTSYDAHPRGYHVEGDLLLAQKLALEDHQRERQFIRMACRTSHPNKRLPWLWGGVTAFLIVALLGQLFNIGYTIWHLWHLP